MRRDLWVYTPKGYSTDTPLPAVLVLPAFAGTGEGFLARGLTDVSFATRLDRLIHEGCPPFIAVMPDTMTSVGGSQYLNSPAIGRYEDYVMTEVRERVGQDFALTGQWGVLGRSSGGFGALHLAMQHPGAFQAVGCHAGDMGFDLMFLGELGPAVQGVQATGGLEHFLSKFWDSHRATAHQFAAFNLIAMACAYTPDVTSSPIPARLPVCFETGTVNFDVLTEWSKFDPIARLQHPSAQDALRALRMLYIDVGNRDEYQLHLGARRFVRGLQQAEIDFVYEEFKGGHRGTAYRFDRSIPILSRALHDSDDAATSPALPGG